jgi:hypothetical protein
MSTLEAVTATRVVLTAALFDSSEAERITEVPRVVIRDWRRHGHLPPLNGHHALFDVFALAHLLALRVFSERAGPIMARQIAAAACLGIAWAALGWHDSWAGDHDLTLSWDADTFTSIQEGDARARRAILAMKPGGGADLAAVLQTIPRHWGTQADWLRGEVWRLRRIEIRPPRFVSWLADGSVAFSESLDAVFDSGGTGDPRFHGGALVADLEALGTVLGERAGRPLFHMELNS